VKHTTAPHRLWEGYGLSDAQFTAKLADDLERLILAEGPDTVGAFIVEPVMGAGGVIVPPQGYYEAVHAIAAKYDLLLIADEVICGFGRLGTTFGSLAVGLKPDLITIAKGLTSAYFPLSGCMVSEKVWRVLADEGGAKFGAFGHGYTYSSHPLGAAAALANLEIVERDGLVQAAADRGRHLHRRLREAFGEHPLVGEIRGFGLIGAVEFVARRDPPLAFDPAVKVGPRIAKAALSRGLVTRALPSADTIAFSPPFVITDAEIDTAIAAARDAVDQVMSELQREGAWRP
jgi:L-2,4-diaminobutyrate transaminase